MPELEKAPPAEAEARIEDDDDDESDDTIPELEDAGKWCNVLFYKF